MAQILRVLVALGEDPSLTPSTHGGAQLSTTPVPKYSTPSSDLHGHQP